MRALFRLLLVLVCLVVAQEGAWGKDYKDYILTRGVLTDPSGNLSLDAVEQSEFEHSDADIVKGYSETPLWVKIEVQPTDQPLFLRVQPTFLDSVTLYWRDPTTHSGWASMVNGDLVALNKRPLPTLSFTFPIDPLVQTTYFLRLQTTSTNIMSTEALLLEDLLKEELHDQVWQMIYYGIMFWMFLWAIAEFIIHRQAVVGLFVAAQLSQILYAWVGLGYLALMLPNVAIGDIVFSSLVLLVVNVSLLFHRVLLSAFDPNRWVLRVTDLMILAGPFLQIILWLGDPTLALTLNGMLLALSPILLLGLAFTAKRDDILTRKSMHWVYAIFTISIVFLVLPLFGITQSFQAYKNGLILQGMLSAFVMTMFLFARSRRMQQDRLLAEIELARSEQKLSNERKRYLEQSRFMDVLTHELNTPISVIQLTSDLASMSTSQRERINRSVDTISGFIERCRISLQVEHAQMQSVMTKTKLQALLLDVVNASLEPNRIVLPRDAGIELDTDPQLLKIVFQNLVDNALKYSAVGSLIQIHSSVTSAPEDGLGVVLIKVTNPLTALAKPDPEKIFQKYYRGIGSIGKSGTGLGLYLAQQLVILLGGRIECQLHEGTISFLITLPVEVSPYSQPDFSGLTA
jgi:two-component system, sensor histidine kinase LadS